MNNIHLDGILHQLHVIVRELQETRLPYISILFMKEQRNNHNNAIFFP